MNLSQNQVDALFDELEKIAGGGIIKALKTNIAPGEGPVHRRLGRGLKSVGEVLKNQVKRYGIAGLF